MSAEPFEFSPEAYAILSDVADQLDAAFRDSLRLHQPGEAAVVMMRIATTAAQLTAVSVAASNRPETVPQSRALFLSAVEEAWDEGVARWKDIRAAALN